jgi:hypothetical protein
VLPVGLLRTVDRISFASNDRAGEQEEQEEEQEEEEGQTDGDPL